MALALAFARTIWLTAANEPVGLGIVVTDIPRARNQLYRAREQLQEAGTDLSNFHIRTSPDNPACELWIIRTRRTSPHQPAAPTAANTEANPHARPSASPGDQA